LICNSNYFAHYHSKLVGKNTIIYGVIKCILLTEGE